MEVRSSDATVRLGGQLDAFVRMNFDPAFRLSFGRFKRSFDIFLLNPIGDIPFLERAGSVPGYQECSGVGSVCSYGRLSERLALHFLGRNRIAVNLDHYRPETGEGVFALRAGVLLY